MVAAMTAFTINDSLIKLIGTDLPFFQMLFLRSCGAVAFLGLLAWQAGRLIWPARPADRLFVAVRSLSELVAAYFFLTALIHMPIANVTAIVQALPLTVTLGAALFLGEPVGWRRFLAIGIGFLGVFLIVRPGSEGFSVYSLYAICAVFAVTVRDLMSRRLSKAVTTHFVAFAGALVVMGFSAIGALWVAWVPVSLENGVWLSGSVLMIVAAYIFSVSAMRGGEVGFVTPFRYTSLIVALVLGLLIFDEWPDDLTLLGAAIIVATGLFTLWREHRLGPAGS